MSRHSKAEPLYVRYVLKHRLTPTLTIREQQLGATHPDTASSLNNLANLYQSMGRYSEAEPLYARSLAIREQQLGADHPDTALGLNNLAVLYCHQNRFAEAEALLIRALAIREQTLGANHPYTVSTRKSLTNLGQAME